MERMKHMALCIHTQKEDNPKCVTLPKNMQKVYHYNLYENLSWIPLFFKVHVEKNLSSFLVNRVFDHKESLECRS